MNVNLKSALILQYDLVKGAPQCVIPYRYRERSDLYILKARSCFSVGSCNYAVIPTGIKIPSFPGFVINPNSQLSVNTTLEAKCISHPDLLERYGIEVLGPIDLDANEEIVVHVYNRSKYIFNVKPGDEVALLSLEIKPAVSLEIDLNQLTMPEDIRR